MKAVEIYTDGACSGNPGKGGYGAVLIYKDIEKKISGYEEKTTNNRMELTAAIKALEQLKEPCKVKLYTDSAYLEKAFNERWIYNWLKNGFINSKKQPVENKDLWVILIELNKIHSIEWIKVKGHADNKYNNICDRLATDAIKSQGR